MWNESDNDDCDDDSDDSDDTDHSDDSDDTDSGDSDDDTDSDDDDSDDTDSDDTDSETGSTPDENTEDPSAGETDSDEGVGMGRKVMASFLPNADGALIILNNLGLWFMGSVTGLVIWWIAPDRRNLTLIWMAAIITFIGGLTGMAAGGFEGFKQWVQSPGVVWLLVAGLSAGTLPMAQSKNGGYFLKMATGLAAGTGAGVLWALLAHAIGQPMALALWPVGALAGGAVALISEDNDGWPAPVIALVAPGPDVTSTTPALPVERA